MTDLYKTLIDEWMNRNLPSVIERDTKLESYLNLKQKKIVVISGFRRAGKTYLLFKLIKKIIEENDKNKVLYLNFEDERIPSETEFLTNLIPAIKENLKDVEFLFLDELQNIPNWSKWLRRINDAENLKIFVTGSSSKMSSKEIPTELRGRFLEINLLPLSFKEFIRFKKFSDSKEIQQLTYQKTEIIRLLKEYIKYGGLPEIVLAEENRKVEIIHSYYNSVIRRDIIERFKIRNEEALKALIQLLINSTNYTISKFYNTLKSLNYEVGKSTVQTFLNHIENSYFLYSLKIFSPKIKEQLQCPRKTYFIDNCFISQLSTKFSDNNSRLYENTVFLELKRKESKKQDFEIYYWKNNQQEEVDFAIKEGLKIKQLIQVCYDITDYDTKKRETRALIKASQELKCKNLLIITENKEGEEKIKGKKIICIPLWKWLLSE